MSKDSKNFEVSHLRSVGASISDGYRLYLDHFRRIFRASWLVALVYALIFGLSSSVLVKVLPEMVFLHSVGMKEGLLSPAVIVVALYTVMSLAATLLFAVGFSLLDGHQQTGTVPIAPRWFGWLDKKRTLRTLTAWGTLLFITLVGGLLLGMVAYYLHQYLSSIAFHVASLVIVVTVLLAASLLVMQMVRFVLSDRRSPFAHFYAPRYWGNIIMISMVVVIITELLSMITELPTNILTIANIQSQTGILKGDPVGTPDYMTWMNLIAFTLAGFIKAYVLLSALFPLYYLNGSIATQEQERAELAQKFEHL